MLTLAPPFTYDGLDTKKPGRYPIAFNPATFEKGKWQDFRKKLPVYTVDVVTFRNGPERSNREFVIGRLEFFDETESAGTLTFEEFLDLATRGNTKLHSRVILHPRKIWLDGSGMGSLGMIGMMDEALKLFHCSQEGNELPEPWTNWHTFL